MHFKHPELLYALLLLIIPILVHLFRLRKFKKEKFTNIKFLKKASLETRKSSRIKKWLILTTRFLLLASIILAFSQPFLPASAESVAPDETVIYLDNSYSMQARGAKGILLKRSIQDLLEGLEKEEEFTLFTNNEIFRDISLKTHLKEIQNITYSAEKQDWKSVEFRAINLFGENSKAQQHFIAISDFQFPVEPGGIEAKNGLKLDLVQLEPESTTNISIDTAFLSTTNLDERVLEIQLKSTGNRENEVPISVYNGTSLLAKKTVVLNDELTARTSLELPSPPIENGLISIEGSGPSFDDQLFFSISKPRPVQVVHIGGEEGAFLDRIFEQPEYELQHFPPNQIDYNKLSEANLIVLNELQELPVSLKEILQKLVQENVFLVVIPPKNVVLGEYNPFLKRLKVPALANLIEREVRITDISFAHPLFQSVFEKSVENFQYPEVGSYFRLGRESHPILGLENREPFLIQEGNVLLFTAPLNKENTNFRNSPLIVPTFYNMGNLALSPNQLYYELDTPVQIDIKAALEQDEILKLASPGSTFIPLQQRFHNSVQIELENSPKEPGHYLVQQDSVSFKTLSFNINRNESKIYKNELVVPEGVQVHQDLSEVFENMKAENTADTLWKWFVIFALFLLMTEMLILKLFK